MILRTHPMPLMPFLAIATLVLVALPLYGEPVRSVRSTGPSDNRVDIVLVGDGYTAAELPKFAADVESFVAGMFAQEPFSSYKAYFNVDRVEVASAESGADHPSFGIFRTTALNATYDCAGIGRLICVDPTAVEDVLARSIHPDGRDVVIVLVNDPGYGGSGGSIAVASTHVDGLEIVLHEVGHSFGLLADEYAGGGPACEATTEPVAPNVTLAIDRASIKWRDWIDPSTPVPTPNFASGGPGLYEGGKHCETGIYRPTADSKMRSLHRPYEQINIQQLITRIYNVVAPIDLSRPAADRVVAGSDERVPFSIVKLRPGNHTLRAVWELDGQQVGTTDGITVDTAFLTPGDHDVRVTVADPTDTVRNDPDQALVQSRSWILHVSTPTPPVVTVLAPNGGEELASDAPFIIRWTATDVDGLARFDVETTSDGINFSPVPECSALPGISASCTVNRSGGPTRMGRVRVTAQDMSGARAFDVSDAAFTITARHSSWPFGEAAASFPGTVEAENFDEGGQSVAYNDLTPGNKGGLYRWTDVDLAVASDNGGGYYVGWTRSGEWLQYTVTVATTGTYTLESRVANIGTGATFHVEVDGVDRTGPIAVPDTGGWQTWQTITTPGIPLTAGQRVMRVVLDTASSGGGVGNYNWFRLVGSTPSSTPYGGTPAALPGTVQAEDFDDGGQSVAHYDLTPGNKGELYRSADADVAVTSDIGGGHYVGWTRAGEWLQYTVTVATTGTHTLETRVANIGTGATFHLEVDGVDRTGPIAVPDTGGWQTWQTITTSGILLTAGQRVIRVVLDTASSGGGVGNYNWFRLAGSTPSAP
jgi:hypothetical protein